MTTWKVIRSFVFVNNASFLLLTNFIHVASALFVFYHKNCVGVAWCCKVRALDSWSWVRFTAIPFSVTTLGKLFTHICLCHQAVLFGADSCDAVHLRRYGVALAMHHRLSASQWYTNPRAQWPERGSYALDFGGLHYQAPLTCLAKTDNHTFVHNVHLFCAAVDLV